MYLSTYQDENKGPLKLEYDITPRDYAHYKPSAQELADSTNFRFRGYPDGNFEKPRDLPLRASIATEKPSTQIEKHYGLPNLFDTKRPKVFEDVKGFKYGSDNLPVTSTDPKPVRDPFNEKSSAELKKYRLNQAEVEEEIGAYKKERMEKMKDREDQKKKDLEMLKSYHPWGRPGGGAPNLADSTEHKKQKFGDEPLHNTPRDPVPKQKELLDEYGDFHHQFGRPGAGAPLRTDSGKLKAELKADTDIRFLDTQKGREVYNKEIRYRKPGEEKHQYFMELDQQVQKKAIKNQDERLSDLRKDMEQLRHDPYGKPGAGAPNTTHSDATRQLPTRAHSEDFDFYDPWGKGVGAPTRDRHGDVQRHKYSDRIQGPFTDGTFKPSKSYDNSLRMSQEGGAGAPKYTDSGTLQARYPITLKRTEKGDATIREDPPLPSKRRPPPSDDPELQVYDPFGKGGAGAPLRDSQGNVITNVYGNLEHDAPHSSADAKQRGAAAQAYLHELQREMEEQKKNKQIQDSLGRTEAGELAVILRQGQVGRPRRDPATGFLANQHLNMTDVTKERTDTRKLKTDTSHEYHTELERAAMERKHLQDLDKLKEKQETKYHANQMDTFWGRPGGGAPKVNGNKKANLDVIINTPRTKPDDYYSKQAGSEKSDNYIRSTVNSKASNLYEMNKAQKREPKENYNLLTPWASNPEEVF